jgi:hypothetical protein
MERTTLTDVDVVATINGGFIPIMVDADKRPDVDSRYNKGGWPTTAFLTADGDVLESHNFLTAQEMLAVLQRVRARFAGEQAPPSPTIAVRPGALLAELEERPEAVGQLTSELPEEIARTVVKAFDREHGGFGAAPKFHHADVLEFALALEVNAYDLHLKMEQRMADPRAQKMFARIADEEKEHLHRLQEHFIRLMTPA